MKLKRWHRIVLVIGIILAQFLAAFRPANAKPNRTDYVIGWSDLDLLNQWQPFTAEGCIPHWTGAFTGWLSNVDCWTGAEHGAMVRLRYYFPSYRTNIHINSVYITGHSVTATYVDGVRYPETDWVFGVPITVGETITGDYIDVEEITADNIDAYIAGVEISYSADSLPGAVNLSTGGVDGTCKLCVYSPTGDWVQDAPALIDYLGCQIGNIFYCHVIPILLGIWRQIVEFMALIQSVIFYGINSANQAGAWVNANTMAAIRYAEGTFDNGVTRIENAIYTSAGTTIISGGSTTSILDVILEFIRQLGTVLNSFVNVIPSIVTAFRDVLISVIGGIVQIAFLLVQLVITLINVLIMVLGVALRVLSIIPLLFGAFSDGFTGSIANPVAPAVGGGFAVYDPLATATILGQPCTDDPYFQMCLGAYVLDNTVLLNDSAEGFSMPGAIAFVKMLAGLVVLVIIARKIRWAFAKA